MFPLAIAAMPPGGDRQWMEHIYQTYRSLMLTVALRYVHNPQDAEELVNETCIRLIPHVGKTREMNTFQLQTFVYKAARSASVDFLRRQEARSPAGPALRFDETLDAQDTEASPMERVVQMSEIDAYIQVLQRLPPQQYQLLFMKYALDYTHAELAHALDLKVASIGGLLSHAKKRAAELLAKERWD